MQSIARLGLIVVALPLASACHDQGAAASAPGGANSVSSGSGNGSAPQVKLALSSSAFSADGAMPSKYSCEGQNVSPPLAWSGAPPSTKSFALIVQDPDAPDPAAPTKVVTHWVVYDLPPTTTAIAEGGAGLPSAAHQAKNEKGDPSYMGPCPPKGNHRYFFKLYALDSVLPALDGSKEKDIEQALQGHVVGTGELVGTYQKSAT
jgi:Raf kinase inhibitor-like YbhB/YbcL family protein